MPEPVKQPDSEKVADQAAKLAEKNTKQQIDSYYEVAKHRLGRAPTMEEVIEVMSEGDPAQKSEHPESEQVLMPNEESPEGPEELTGPRILHMKVYHGMKDGEEGTREPDEGKILYYESPEGGVYDCSTQEWQDDRPSIVDHLHSRPMQYEEKDLVAAIVNGVMDDDDYTALDEVGMMGDSPRQLWDLTKRLQTQVEDLEQSQEELPDHLGKSDDSDEEEGLSGDSGQMDSEYEAEESEPVGNSDELTSEGDTEEVQGTDLIAEVVRSAMSEALTGPYLEASIRKIVREEMSGGKKEEEIPQNEEITVDTDVDS